MANVKVYQFREWDNKKGDWRYSETFGLRETAERLECDVIEGTEREVDSSELDSDGKVRAARI